MKETTKRSILRWIHIIFGLTIIGYVLWSAGGSSTVPRQFSIFLRSGSLPLTGFWMWKGPGRSTTFFKKIGLTRLRQRRGICDAGGVKNDVKKNYVKKEVVTRTT